MLCLIPTYVTSSCLITNTIVDIPSYVEGIYVLFSTNTFFIESQAILDALFCPGPHIHHLVPQERLASITSLELIWDLSLFGRLPNPEPDKPDHRRAADRDRLATHLRRIGDVCPNLTSLVLSFTEALYFGSAVKPRDALDEIDQVLLRPLADAVACLPRQKWPVVVELPEKVFDAVRRAARDQLLGLQPPIDEQHDGVWLQYPLTPSGHQVNSGDGLSPGASSAPNLRCRYDTDGDQYGDQYSYYYIKEGVCTTRYWECTMT